MATTTLTPAAPAYRSALYEWLTTTDHKKIGITNTKTMIVPCIENNSL